MDEDLPRINPEKGNHRGEKLNKTETEILCRKIEKLRIHAGLTYREIAKELGYCSKTIQKKYEKYTEEKRENLKENYEEEVMEIIERQKDIIRRARAQSKLKVEEIANRNLLSMLQSLGFAPTVPQKIEHSGAIWDLKRIQDEYDEKGIKAKEEIRESEAEDKGTS